MIKRKLIVLSLLTLVSTMLAGLLYSNLVQAQSTVTGYVSVPAAAFVPYNSTKHTSTTIKLVNYAGEYMNYYGAVQLPHGATVTNLTSYWYDAYEGLLGGYNVLCWLRRYNQTHDQWMALASSSGDPGYGSSYDDTIDNATVDNSQYAYYLWVEFPHHHNYTEFEFHYAIIEYTLPSEAAVGGLYIPVDKLSLLAPYIALVSTIILAVSISVAYIKHRKKQ